MSLKLTNSEKEYYIGQAEGLLKEIRQNEQSKIYISEKLTKLNKLLDE